MLINKVRTSLLSRLRASLIMNVYAEEPITEPSNGNKEDDNTPPVETTVPKPQGTVDFEVLIANARKEEKDKLYPQMEKLKKDKNDLLLVVAERDATIKELEKSISELQKNHSKLAKDVEDSTSTNKVVQEQALLISQLEQQLEDIQAQYEVEINSVKLTSFRDKQIAIAGGEIIPELVTGNTEEEIIASIEVAKQRYQDIQAKALSNVQMPRSVNPSVTTLSQNALKSVEDIAKMTPQEWAEYRKNLKL